MPRQVLRSLEEALTEGALQPATVAVHDHFASRTREGDGRQRKLKLGIKAADARANLTKHRTWCGAIGLEDWKEFGLGPRREPLINHQTPLARV